MNENFSLAVWQKIFLLLFSFLLVAFGQPAWSEWLSLLAAFIGFASFWRVLLAIPSTGNRFFIAMGWFAAVQIVQFSWSLSHPFLYIYAILFICASLFGAQWGLIGMGIQPANIRRIVPLIALAGLWALLEWSRLFLLSGLPFNPVGLTLSGSLYSLQFASLLGIYGLSFWVMLTNLLVLRAWIFPMGWTRWSLAGAVALLPFAFGWVHLAMHKSQFKQNETLSVVLVQSALPIEENLSFQSAEEARHFVLDEWRHVLTTLKKQAGQKIDLIVFPEYLVPYGTFHHIYPVKEIEQLLQELFGNQVTGYPTKKSPLMSQVWTDRGQEWLVSNAYVAQTLANFFQAHVVLGLEDSRYEEGKRVKGESYSSAFHFIPNGTEKPARYEKRVLLPMGEYIPFEWCRTIAAKYGISGSFTCGAGAKVFQGPVPFGASICYEELFGDMMRENRMQGAELLVNLTNDGWYPNSRLPKQHFDHARLRTVENGIPLIRACNTGITGAYDSLGRVVGILGEDHMQMQEVADSIRLDVPKYHYSTLYSKFGDFPILAISCFALILGWIFRKRT